MDKYRKNFIQFDGVVYYCFICEEQFCGIENFEKHIRWQNHRKSLKNQNYFPKFRKDFIYKIENHFYCEVCNVAVSSSDAVTEHINSIGHKAMKTDPKTETKIIGQCDSGKKFNPGDLVVINQFKLKMFEWQSIIDNTCLICNTRVPDMQKHMKTKDHNIQLMNSGLLIENEHYYRKITNDKYHCFSCKKAYSAQEFSDHWLGRQNIKESNNTQHEEVTSTESIENPTQIEANVNKTLVQSISHFQDLFNISAGNNLATCKTCNAEVAVNFVPMLAHVNNYHNELAMNIHPNTADSSDMNVFSHNQLEINTSRNTADSSDINVSSQENVYSPIKDHGKQRSELAKYGKEHSIKLIFPSSKGWCTICDRYLSAHKKIFEEHVNGTTHQGNLELQGLASPNERETRSIQTKSILECNLEHVTNEFLVNSSRTSVFSFFLIFKIEDKHRNKVKCYACNELFPQGQERVHCSSDKHKTNFLAAKFVITFEKVGQFIREIRPNFFHCGFCNKTIPFLELVREHLASLSHKAKQTTCNMTKSEMDSTKINIESDDVYLELLECGFGKN